MFNPFLTIFASCLVFNELAFSLGNHLPKSEIGSFFVIPSISFKS